MAKRTKLGAEADKAANKLVDDIRKDPLLFKQSLRDYERAIESPTVGVAMGAGGVVLVVYAKTRAQEKWLKARFGASPRFNCDHGNFQVKIEYMGTPRAEPARPKR